jgi:hypothetical protein
MPWQFYTLERIRDDTVVPHESSIGPQNNDFLIREAYSNKYGRHNEHESLVLCDHYFIRRVCVHCSGS